MRRFATSLSIIVLLFAGLSSSGAQGSTAVAGIPAELVGIHGPLADVTDGLEIVGHAPMVRSGQPLGNHGGLALIDDCAYVGRWHDYRGTNAVTILDIADPTLPQVVGGVPGTAVSGGVAREIRGIDVAGWKVLVVLVFSDSLGDRRNNHLLLYTFPSGDCRQPVATGDFDLRAVRGHEFALWLDPVRTVDGHPRALVYLTAPVGPPNIFVIDISDPALPLLVGTYDAAQPVVSPREPAGTYLGNYAHSISLSPDGRTAYVSYWDGGYLTLDASLIADGVGGTLLPDGARSVPLRYPDADPGNTHSAVRLDIGSTNETVVVGDEIYLSTDGCPFGWMRFIDSGSATEPASQIGEFRLDENRMCSESGGRRYAASRNSAGALIDGTFSMHNQTVVGPFVFASWYGGGLRVVDASDPSTPTESAMFVPAPLEVEPSSRPVTSAPVWGIDSDRSNDWQVAMWSYPIIRDGLIYVVDIRNGLYILRPSADAAFASAVTQAGFVEGNSNVGSFD